MSAKLLVWIVVPILGLIVLGWIVIGLVMEFAFYLAVGAVAVGLAMWAWKKLRGVGSARKQVP